MVENKIPTGGLNTDDSDDSLPNGDYRYALNVRIGTTDNQGFVENVKGNTRITGFTLPAGTNTLLGTCVDELNDKLYWLVHNTGGLHTIWEYRITPAPKTITKIIENKTDTNGIDVLGFNLDYKVHSINVLDGKYLMWTDGLGEPKSLDIAKCKDIVSVGQSVTISGEGNNIVTNNVAPFAKSLEGRWIIINGVKKQISYVTNDGRIQTYGGFDFNGTFSTFKHSYYGGGSYMADAIKYAPKLAPYAITIGDDRSKSYNYIKNNLFKFKIQYIYDNGTQSVLSTATPLVFIPLYDLKEYADEKEVWKNNFVNFAYDITNESISKVNIYVSENNSDYLLYDTIDIKGGRSKYKQKTIIHKSGMDVASANDTYSFTLQSEDFSPQTISFQYDGNIPAQKKFGYICNELANQINNNALTNISAVARVVGSTTSHDAYLEIESRFVGKKYSVYNASSQLTITSVGNISDFRTGEYYFYNDKLKYPVDLADAIRLQDFLPEKATSQELVNGNVMIYGGVTQGKDSINVNASVEVETDPFIYGLGGGNLQITVQSGTAFTFTGTGANGDLYKLTWDGGSVFGKQTVFYAPSPSDNKTAVAIAQRFRNIIQTRYEVAGNGATITTSLDTSNVVTPNVFSNNAFSPVLNGEASISTYVTTRQCLKTGDSYPVGIVYYDKAGRVSSVQRSADMVASVPFNGQQGYSELPRVKLTIKHLPPSWADYYRVVFGKRKIGDFKQFVCQFVETITSGTIAATISNAAEGSVEVKVGDGAIYIDNLKEYLDSFAYSFTEGDKLRVITSNGNNVTSYEEIVIRGLYTDKNTFQQYMIVSNYVGLMEKPVENDIVELVTLNNIESGDLIYYEAGNTYDVLESNGIKYHAGDSNQDPLNPISSPCYVAVTSGDVFYRTRQYKHGQTNQTTNNRNLYQAKDYSDYFVSEGSNLSRPNVYNESAKQVFIGNTMYFSGEYSPIGGINGINTFYETSFKDVSITYGGIVRLKASNRLLIVYQRLKTGAIPINERIIEDNGGQQLLVRSQSLLNDIRYYDGDWGIGDQPFALTSYGSYHYFIDPINGLAIRRGLNGLEPISITYKMNKYFSEKARAYLNQGSSAFIKLGYDPRFNECIIHFPQIGSEETAIIQAQETLSFNEKTNRFQSYYSYAPEFMENSGNNFFTFKENFGYLHNNSATYNNFYLTQYTSKLQVVFNQAPLNVKTYLAQEQFADSVWANETITTDTAMLSNLVASDFETREGVHFSSYLRNQNTPNKTNPLLNGDTLKGRKLNIVLTNSATTYQRLFGLNNKSIESPLVNRM